MPHWRRKNKSRSWQVSVSIDGKRYLKTLPGRLSKRDVAAWEREWHQQLQGQGAPSTDTVASLIERYWQDKGQHRAKNRTLRAYLGLWALALGRDTPATQVHSQHVSAIIARWRKEPRSGRSATPICDATVNRRTDALRVAWSYAAEILGVPVAALPWKRLRLAEPEPPAQSIGR